MGNTKIKAFASLLLVVALLLASPILTHAEEEAKYNFASAQGSKQIKVTPGGESRGVVYFYNIDGNRITHVTLKVAQAPDNWKVEIEPPLHETVVNVSGLTVTVTENLYVEPSQAFPEEPKDVPEGMVSIAVPKRGHVLARPAYIIIRVPESAEIGSSQEIRISAVAEWLGQSGAAAIKQARDFDFTVQIASPQTTFSETIVSEKKEPEAKTPAETIKPKETTPAKESGSEIPRATAEETPASGSTNWMPVIIAAVIVVLGAVLIPMLVARKRG